MTGVRSMEGTGTSGRGDDPRVLRKELERLEAENRSLRSERARLLFRRQELNSALQTKHEEFLEMLDRLQEREEDAVRRALKDLSRSEERFRLVVEGIRDYAIYLLDRDGRITSWNYGAAQLLGYQTEEVQGRSFTMFVAPDEGAEGDVERMIEQAKREGRVEQEGWRISRNGDRLWVSEILTALRDNEGRLTGFVDITRDLTQRRQAEQALEDSATELARTVADLRRRTEEAEQARRAAEEARRRVSFLAEASQALTGTLDERQTLTSLVDLAVPSLADWIVVHLPTDEGEAQIEVVHRDPERSAAARRLEAGGVEGLEAMFELSAVMEEREPRIVQVEPSPEEEDEIRRAAHELGLRSAVVAPLVGRDELIGAVVFVVGDSGRTYGPEDLALAHELARRAATALDNERLYSAALVASRAKSDFLAVMSHELRTPLNAIVGYIDLLKSGIVGPLTDRQAQHLERVRVSARHLLQLIEGILSYSRLEAGKKELELEEVIVADLIGDVVDMLEPQARKKNLDLRADVAPDIPAIDTDPAKLRQILLNLVSNAVKFTERGVVSVTAGIEGEKLLLRVADTGPGIDEIDLERIFEPFWQGGTAAVGQQGTGLGLSVSLDLARILGGDLRAESRPGEGSRFTVELPLRPPEGHERTDDEPESDRHSNTERE